MKRWTPKLAVARSDRHLNAAMRHLAEVGAEWGDVDNTYVMRADELIRDLEAFAGEIRDEIAERLAAGDHVGL